jgi:hypothetical protein
MLLLRLFRRSLSALCESALRRDQFVAKVSSGNDVGYTIFLWEVCSNADIGPVSIYLTDAGEADQSPSGFRFCSMRRVGRGGSASGQRLEFSTHSGTPFYP